jgi:hypothetical protein
VRLKVRMREEMKDSGEVWNANVSERPRRVEDVPRGSWGGGLGILNLRLE